MKLIVSPNKKFQVVLTDKHFIASGGEGSIYGKDDVIYKIYENYKRAISIRKINELSILTKDNIVNPIEPLYDSKSILIGYTMKWVKDTEILCKLFTNTFHRDKNITLEQIIGLISNFQDTIEFIHNKKCLIVDVNEFNFLVDKQTYKIPYFIDTDSYQTQSYPCTAIMPTIKDYHQSSFTQTSDWFSFGILAFQLFTGLHPYKGTHPKYSKCQLIDRMKANISVFNKNVSIPNNIRSIDNIPQEYKKWFYDVFENGKRLAPPVVSPFQQVYVPTKHKSFILQSSFDISSYKVINEKIIHYFVSNGTDIIFTNKYLYCNSLKFVLPESYNKKKMTALNWEGITYFIWSKKNCIQFIDVKTNEIIECQLPSNGILNVNGDIYSIYNDKLQHIKLQELNHKLFISTDNYWNILPNSTYQFTNILYSNVLSTCYLYIPLENGCDILHIKELDHMKIIDMKRENNVVVIVYVDNGKYHEMTLLLFNEVYTIVSIDMNINYSGLNFIITNQNVMIKLDSDNEMLLMSTSDLSQKKRIKNDNLSFDMSLACYNSQVRYYIDNEIYNISMRKNP